MVKDINGCIENLSFYRKGFALCRQPPTCNLRPVERIDFEILVILPQEIA